MKYNISVSWDGGVHYTEAEDMNQVYDYIRYVSRYGLLIDNENRWFPLSRVNSITWEEVDKL